MSSIKRLKVSFIDKDKRCKIEDLHRILVHVDPLTEQLVAELYPTNTLSTKPTEVEIRIQEEL